MSLIKLEGPLTERLTTYATELYDKYGPESERMAAFFLASAVANGHATEAAMWHRDYGHVWEFAAAHREHYNRHHTSA